MNSSKNVTNLEPSKFNSKTFFASYLPSQNWSIPDSIIYHMALNPLSTTAYQKLIKCCKYFYAKNKIIVAENLKYNRSKKWLIRSNEFFKYLPLPEMAYKIWIIDSFEILNDIQNAATSIVPQFFRFDFNRLSLSHQNITFNEFLLLSSNVEDIFFNDVIVMNDDGSVATLEKLFETLPNIKKIHGNFKITTDTVKELLKFKHFSTIKTFDLWDIPEAFDIDRFFAFVKKSKITKISLRFDNSISEEYKNRLDAIIDEILDTKVHDYNTPYLHFPGIDRKKWDKIIHFFYNSFYGK